MKKKSIVFITNYIPIYRTPIYEALCNNNSLSITIFTSDALEKSCERAIKLLPIKLIKGFNIIQKLKFKEVRSEQIEKVSIPYSLFFDLYKLKPDIIFSSELGLRSLVCLMYAKIFNKVIIISSEEIINSAKVIGVSRKIIRKILFSKANAFLAWGVPAKEYLLKNFIPDNQIFLCAQAVDNEHWSSPPADFDRAYIRTQYKIKGKLFLSVGRLVKRKGFDLLIESWSRLPEKIQQQNTLMLVGDGPEKEPLISLTNNLDIPNFIHVPWSPYKELPKYYAMADVFVFPSLIDVWGLVLNEAMANGLPAIASRYAGSSQQLITSDNIGELIDPNNIEEFTHVLQKWINKNCHQTNGYIREAIYKINFNDSIKSIEQAISDYSFR